MKASPVFSIYETQLVKKIIIMRQRPTNAVNRSHAQDRTCVIIKWKDMLYFSVSHINMVNTGMSPYEYIFSVLSIHT